MVNVSTSLSTLNVKQGNGSAAAAPKAEAQTGAQAPADAYQVDVTDAAKSHGEAVKGLTAEQIDILQQGIDNSYKMMISVLTENNVKLQGWLDEGIGKLAFGDMQIDSSKFGLPAVGTTPEEAAKAAIERAGGVHVGVQMLVPCLFHTPQANIGVFHESNFDLTDRLTVTAGLRYDYTHSKIEYDTRGDFRLNFSIMGQDAMARVLSLYQHDESAGFSQLLPKFGLTYKFDNGSNIYATVTKGYRAGGFNIDIIQNDIQANAQTIMAAAQEAQTTHQNVEKVIEQDDAKYETVLDGIRFKPEESWNYEIGAHLNLFDNLIHADLSAYYMQIRNQQLSVFTPDYGFGRRMVNAGKSYSCGLEATLRGSAVSNHLLWSATYGFTHAAFKDYTTKSSSAATATDIDYSGNKVPYIPAHTIAATLDYTFDTSLGFMKSLTVGLNTYGQGKIWWDEANTYAQKFYAVLGARVAADFGFCKLNLWARNLTDSKYNTFAFSSKATGREVFMAQRGNPFQLGFDLSFHF